MFLDVPPEWLDLIVILDPFWWEGVLYVNKMEDANEDTRSQLARVILYLYKFRTTTSSRWCITAPSSRTMIRSCSCGLKRHVQVVLDSTSVGDFWLGGFKKFVENKALNLFVFVTAFVGLVADSLLMNLMHDDRLLMHLEQYKADMENEMRYVESMPDLIWERCFWLMEENEECSSPADFRGHVLQGVLMCHAFIYRKVFANAESPPFNLTQGDDIEGNVKKLAEESEAPQGPTT